MKILKKDLRHNTLTVVPESHDDLWLLEKLIGKGDVISGYTVRTIKIRQGDKEIKSEKRRIFVRLAVEKKELSQELRVGGTIMESSDGDHSHHTFEIEENQPVTIERDWKNYELERLERAKRKRPAILIIALDDGEASFALLTERLEMLATIGGATGKSMGEQDSTQYYGEIIKYIKSKSFDFVIVAGPGFAKEKVMALLRDTETAKRAVMDSVSCAGEAGIQEVLRRGIVERVAKDSEASEQSKLVEEFFTAIARGKAAYGKEEVKKAVEMGAVATLLVSEDVIHDCEEMMKKAESMGGTVKIIDSHHDAGKRFLAFGGIGAFLRYEV
ncbi:MAG: mRNA surveillance protein pelota [Candidatus Aenigmarchaeota archaeon]|nr:mRNA surveillance protein pelota [Candidatus Aenigmarchaeota archaeon]